MTYIMNIGSGTNNNCLLLKKCQYYLVFLVSKSTTNNI